MSLIITAYVPEGIVQGSDSRQFLTAEGSNPDGTPFKMETINSDHVKKSFLLKEQGVGISSFGNDLLGGVPMASHIKRFIEEDLDDDSDITTIPQQLVDFIETGFGKVDTGFHISGYKKEGRVSVPYVYYCHVKRGIVERRNLKPDGSVAYGATWSGQADVLSSLLNPVTVKRGDNEEIVRTVAPVIWDAMSLQDAVDFIIYGIRTTIDTMRFQARPKNVGGAIDLMVVRQEGSDWVQEKQLTGTNNS